MTAAELLQVAGARLGLSVRTNHVGVAWLHGSLGRGPIEVVGTPLSVLRHQVPIELLMLAVAAPFAAPLGEGLRIAPSGQWADLAAAGRTGFAGRFGVTATDPARGAALAGPAGDHLDAAFACPGTVTVDDRGVELKLERPAPWFTPDEPAAIVRHVDAARRAIEVAADALPPDPALAPLHAVLTAAAPAGATVRRGILRLHGPDGEVTVGLRPAGAGAATATVALTIGVGIPGRPVVTRESSFGWFDRLGEWFSGRPELTTGDAAFDQRFAVRSSAPELLMTLLDAESRAALLALDAIVPARLGAGGVDATGPVAVGDAGALVQAALRIARALGLPGSSDDPR